MKNNKNTKPVPNHDSKFWIHPDDFNKVIQYAAASYSEYKAEIGGQMIVVQDEQGDFILKDPEIMKQTVSSGECNLDAAELALYYSRNAGKYDDNIRFCWWHSHHTMGAFWSGTDDDTILRNPSKDWTLSLVVNLKKEYKLRIQFFEPFLHEVNVELNFLTVESEIEDSILEEVKEKCTTNTITPIYSKNSKQGVFGFTKEDPWDYQYGGYDVKRHYNQHTGKYFNSSGIPAKVLNDAEDAITEVCDELSTIVCEKEAYNIYKQRVKKLNKGYKKHNFKIIQFDNPDMLQSALIAFWDTDYFENIKNEVIS